MYVFNKMVNRFLDLNWLGHYYPEKQLICLYDVDKENFGKAKKECQAITKKFKFIIEEPGEEVSNIYSYKF